MKSNDKRFARRRSASNHLDEVDEADCSAFFDDVGVSRRKKQLVRAQQLCRQVFRAVSCTLSGECGDEVLQDLVVDSVVPAPDASRMMINVYPTTLRGRVSVAEILERLGRVEGFLRREVATAIVRKRAPELLFNVIVPGEGNYESA
ncbi:MAG: ribosome-binding factor A [Planctomycetota bacterium]|nr:ribosome-binding factor A [Planctomycetota bacterium]